MAAPAVKLKTVARSPATLQYTLPKPTATGRPLYKRQFYPNEDAKESLSQPWLAKTDPMMPPYPYGKNQHFEEANHGLYGGATIQSGNKISDGRNKGKTLRKWYPNVRVEKLKSNALKVELAIPTVARVMRTIQKCGGLDEYLLGEKPARIKELGLLGWKLRWLIMKSNAVKDRHTQERLKLGVPSTLDLETQFSEVWADPEMQSSLIEKMHAGWQELKEKDARFQKHWDGSASFASPNKALNSYDLREMSLPQEVEEDFIELPKVQTGFGILTPATNGPVASNTALSGPTAKPVNKVPGKSHEFYEGGAKAAVAPHSFKKAVPIGKAKSKSAVGRTQQGLFGRKRSDKGVRKVLTQGSKMPIYKSGRKKTSPRSAKGKELVRKVKLVEPRLSARYLIVSDPAPAKFSQPWFRRALS